MASPDAVVVQGAAVDHRARSLVMATNERPCTALPAFHHGRDHEVPWPPEVACQTATRQLPTTAADGTPRQVTAGRSLRTQPMCPWALALPQPCPACIDDPRVQPCDEPRLAQQPRRGIAVPGLRDGKRRPLGGAANDQGTWPCGGVAAVSAKGAVAHPHQRWLGVGVGAGVDRRRWSKIRCKLSCVLRNYRCKVRSRASACLGLWSCVLISVYTELCAETTKALARHRRSSSATAGRKASARRGSGQQQDLLANLKHLASTLPASFLKQHNANTYCFQQGATLVARWARFIELRSQAIMLERWKGVVWQGRRSDAASQAKLQACRLLAAIMRRRDIQSQGRAWARWQAYMVRWLKWQRIQRRKARKAAKRARIAAKKKAKRDAARAEAQRKKARRMLVVRKHEACTKVCACVCVCVVCCVCLSLCGCVLCVRAAVRLSGCVSRCVASCVGGMIWCSWRADAVYCARLVAGSRGLRAAADFTRSSSIASSADVAWRKQSASFGCVAWRAVVSSWLPAGI